jgi:hypothetical protein
MNLTKALIKRMRYFEGKSDCIAGLSPKSTSRFYLRGYCDQYAKEQILSALSKEAF